MSYAAQLWEYYLVQWQAAREGDRERGEISTTTVVLTALLVALAIAVGGIITSKVRNKAETIDLG
jgi:hypothetical protein